MRARNDLTPSDAEALKAAVGVLAEWCARINPRTGKLAPATTGLRAIALTWAVKPAALGTPAPSMHQLSKRLGCTDTILSRYATEFRERFGIKSRGQRSDETRQRMRRAHRGLRPPSDPSRN